MVFSTRPLAGPETLGQRLRHLREEAHLSLDEVASQLSIAKKYLTAIEASQYQAIPGQVYARSFVRLYAARLGLNETSAMERFDQEYELTQAARPSRRPLLAARARTEIPWWRRHLRMLTAAVSILIVASFFSWQIVRLYVPPMLLVIQPSADMTTQDTAVTVSGQTDPGAKVAINNQEIEVQANGQFSEKVDLNVGLNTLKVTAKKPRSGDRVIIRQVLVEE